MSKVPPSLSASTVGQPGAIEAQPQVGTLSGRNVTRLIAMLQTQTAKKTDRTAKTTMGELSGLPTADALDHLHKHKVVQLRKPGLWTSILSFFGVYHKLEGTNFYIKDPKATLQHLENLKRNLEIAGHSMDQEGDLASLPLPLIEYAGRDASPKQLERRLSRPLQLSTSEKKPEARENEQRFQINCLKGPNVSASIDSGYDEERFLPLYIMAAFEKDPPVGCDELQTDHGYHQHLPHIRQACQAYRKALSDYRVDTPETGQKFHQAEVALRSLVPFSPFSRELLKRFRDQMSHDVRSQLEPLEQKLNEAHTQELSHVETKEVGSCRASTTHLIGKRPTQEDAHFADEVSLGTEPSAPKVPVFAICDGHGGPGAAQFFKDRGRDIMADIFRKAFDGQIPQSPRDDVLIENALTMVGVRVQEELGKVRAGMPFYRSHMDILQSGSKVLSGKAGAELASNNPLRGQLLEVESQLRERGFADVAEIVRGMRKNGSAIEESTINEHLQRCKELIESYDRDVSLEKTYYHGGTTLTMSTVIEGNVWTANVGDSRTIAVDGGGQAHQLTEDATLERGPFLREYQQRGGTVTRDPAGTPRTAGGLMVPCSIGEREVAVTARSTVSKYPIPPGGTTLVLGCDGLFDYLSSNDVARVVSSQKGEEQVEALAPRLAKAAFAQGSTDNISAMVVRIPPRPPAASSV